MEKLKEFGMNNISFSQRDIQRGIIIPKRMSLELAELIGILLGDGHLGIYSKKGNKNNMWSYELNIAGHLTEDFDYFTHINQIFRSLFNIPLNIKPWKARNTILATIGSKAITTFFKSISFPIGNKNNGRHIPFEIMFSSKKEKASFLRGIADTDFSLTFKKRKKTLHSYPVIKAGLKSKIIVKDLEIIFSELGLHPTCCKEVTYDHRFQKNYIKYLIQVSGHESLKRWKNLIGFRNQKHLTKLLIWEGFGFCPPYTSLAQRRLILDGKLDPYSFYK